jgi:hypothetical protein
MLNISKQQALQRWEVLPDSLREALFSEYNADTLWKICQDQHLPEDKIKKIAILLGDVILGFEHFDDLAKDISLETGINQQIANSIVQEADRKIFLPIKSDIEKNYKPAPPEPLPTRQPVVEVKPMEKPAEAPAESSSFAKATADKQKPISPLDILKETPKETPIAPKPLIETPVAKPVTPSTPPAPQTPNPPAPKPSTPPASPLAKGPLIIHKETEFKPLSESKKSLGGFFSFLNKGGSVKKEIISPVKAKVEIGPETFGVKKEPSPVKPAENKPVEQPKVKVVNYSGVPSSVPVNPFSSGPAKPKIQTAPAIGKSPEISPKPTLRDLSKPAPDSFIPKNEPIAPSTPGPVSPRPLTPEPARQSPDGLSRMADGRSDLSASNREASRAGGGQAKPPAPLMPSKPEEPKKEENGNVIDLRSFK